MVSEALALEAGDVINRVLGSLLEDQEKLWQGSKDLSMSFGTLKNRNRYKGI